MSVITLTAAQVLYGANDLTPFTGGVNMNGKVNMVDVTTMGMAGYHGEAPGIRKFTTNVHGISDMGAAGVNSLILPTAVGTQYAIAINPTGGVTAGDPSFFTRGVLSDDSPWGGNIGAASKFNMVTTSDTAMVGGFVAAPLLSRGALTGAAVTMAGPTVSQSLYAGLWVTGAVGTNLAVTVQSAPASNFTSPTTRLTFATVSAAGWQWLVYNGAVTGAITDGFWRVLATVGTSTFTWAASFAVFNNS
jgi:hypothetical protein